jgi:WD40 repeat protein
LPGTRTYLSRTPPVGRFAILGLILAAGWFLFWPDFETALPTTTPRDLVFIDSEIGNINDLPSSLSFSPDGRQILLGTPQAVYLHDAQTGTLLKRFWSLSYDPDMRTPIFSPDGRHFVTTPLSNAKLWDLETGLAEIVFSGHTPRGWITSATFSPDGHRLVTAAEDNTARIWDTEGATPHRFAPIETRRAILTLVGHTQALTSAGFSMDGRRVLTASRLDHTARLWDADTGQPIAVFSSERREMIQAIFSPNGRRVLTLSAEQARLWDAGDGRPLLKLDAEGPFRAFGKAAFSADGRSIITVGGLSTTMRGRPYISLWDADSGQLLQTTGGASSTIPGPSSFFTDARFSPDGRRVATTSSDGKVQLWDVNSGGELVTLSGPAAVASHPVFSPDGRRLAASFFRDIVKVWQLLDDAPYHDPAAATLVQREVPDFVEWITGRYRLARRRLGLAL